MVFVVCWWLHARNCLSLCTDGRHPDNVEFTSSLIEDLRRRDFTVNAMAYGIHDGLIDPFNGRDDIKNKIIRTVGAPEKRFEEERCSHRGAMYWRRYENGCISNVY